MIVLLVLAAILAGAAVLALLWGFRSELLEKFGRDVEWMRSTYARFYPEEINATLYTGLYYAGFAVLLGLLMWALPSPVLAVIFWVVALFLPGMFIEWAWKRRLREVDSQISQSVTNLANSMRSGLTLVQAMTRLSEQAPEPIKTEFKIMVNQYGYGSDMETVLKSAKERLKLQNFNLFVSALLLNREMGGDISETLTRISKSLDKLREMRKTVEAHTSEGRTNIKVLLIAPIGILLLVSLIASDAVMMLFTTTPGVAVLMIAAALAGTGAYLAHRITKSEI
jgi:tight adherence protein B